MPNMNNSNNLKTSEILTLAYKQLWNGDFIAKQYEYSQSVCGAVADAVHKLDVDSYTPSGADDYPHPYRASQDRFRDYMDSILAKTESTFYSSHLARLGVPRSLILNPEWMQLRRRELLCSIISHFESIID